MLQVTDLIDHFGQHNNSDYKRYDATDYHLYGQAGGGTQHTEANKDNVQHAHLADATHKGGYIDGLHDVQLKEAPEDGLETLEYIFRFVFNFTE